MPASESDDCTDTTGSDPTLMVPQLLAVSVAPSMLASANHLGGSRGGRQGAGEHAYQAVPPALQAGM